MSRQRRSFSSDFKLEAARLVVDQGYSIAEAARSLDIGTTAIRRWVKQLEAELSGGRPASKALTTEQQKIQALEARVNRLQSVWNTSTMLLRIQDKEELC
ncbi:transposase [Microbulbifer sp. PSTR4-B]|uniref:transposase n=1 Tax=Microbulbifer sp. PSTR4-B TaxID=3243396 RepID=UPI004039FCFF